MLMSTSGAACFLHNLLVIVTISGWILSGRCPYFTASVLIALDLPPANYLDFFFSGTTLTSDLLFQHLFWGSLPLTFIPSSLLHFFLIHIGFYLIYFTIDFHLVVIFIQSSPCSGPRIFSLNLQHLCSGFSLLFSNKNVVSSSNSAIFAFSSNSFSFVDYLEQLLEFPFDAILLFPFDEALDEPLSAESLNQLWILCLKLNTFWSNLSNQATSFLWFSKLSNSQYSS